MCRKYINIIGQRFGSYTVVERVIKEDDKNTYFKCICDCGKETIVCSQHLRYGKAKQCRDCFESKHNLIGRKFDKLVVIKDGGLNNYKKPTKQWLCKCECGNEVLVTTQHLLDGYSTSCGCKTKYKDRSEAALNSLYSSYRRSATSRNLDFNITRSEFKLLTKKECHYCGEQPKQEFKRGSSIYIYNGIDRKNNLIGYTIENSVSCCKTCNIAKHTMTVKEFFTWIKKIFNRIK